MNTVIQLASDSMGRGDEGLGRTLMSTFVNVLSQLDTVPSALVLFNTGVKLACEGSELIDALRELETKGATILCCGTCLNFFNLKDKVLAGRASNMIEITETMLQADKVITI